MYERTSIKQQESVSEIIASTTKKAFETDCKENTSVVKPSGGEPQVVSFGKCENCVFNFQIHCSK